MKRKRPQFPAQDLTKRSSMPWQVYRHNVLLAVATDEATARRLEAQFGGSGLVVKFKGEVKP